MASDAATALVGKAEEYGGLNPIGAEQEPSWCETGRFEMAPNYYAIILRHTLL